MSRPKDATQLCTPPELPDDQPHYTALYIQFTSIARQRISQDYPDPRADFLFMFEGMAQGGLGANWGDGHATDADLMNLVHPAAFMCSMHAVITRRSLASDATTRLC